MSKFTLDTKDFDMKFDKLVKQDIPKRWSPIGLFNAASEALRDADKEAPQTPKDKGDLRGSKTIEKVKIAGRDVSIKMGYNIDYAAKVHESEPGTINFVSRGSITQPGSKFLETKLVRHKKKYMGIVAETIRRGG